MEVEQDYMVMSGRYKGQEGNGCYGHMVVLQKRDVRESGRMESFLFYFFLIKSLTFVIFLRVEIDEGAFLALASISEALEVVNVILLSV